MTARTTFTPLDLQARGRVLRIAHRGASAYAPENSLIAFEKAAAMGADSVEIDIHITADDVPVVSHDDTLKRVFGIDAAIRDLPLSSLQALMPADREPIPTFEQVVATCADLKLGLYLDVKRLNRPGGQQIFEILGRYGLIAFSVFGSFQPDLIAGIKAAMPAVRTSILFGSTAIRPVAMAEAVSADFVHPCWENAAEEPHKLLTSAWIDGVRAAGLGIVCWHEERPTEIAALRDLGVDAICSDTPDILTQFT
jgi:glycerophosphoryl diester phosphodiesterase